MLARAQVVKLLEEFSTLLELLDEDEFKARAYANAARQLDSAGDSMEALLEANRLSTVRGIGSGLAATIRDLATAGSFADLEKARARVPRGVFELLRVEGLGPKKARALWRDANVLSLADLEDAIDAGRLVRLTGFGNKSLEKFRASIEFIKATGSRRLRNQAKQAAREIEEAVKKTSSVESVHFCGSLRRGMETVGDLDCIVCASDIEKARAEILALSGVTWNETSGRIIKRRETDGMEIELSVCLPLELAHRLLLATGSKPHLSRLKECAAARGLTLDDRGLCRGDVPIHADSEAELYKALGLRFVPPPLREEQISLLTPDEPDYPRAMTRSDLRGILHVHSKYSDGHNTLRELAQAMIERGFQYLGVADHSQIAAYARGLSPERVKEQWREIDHLNSDLAPFRILKGTECDILPDGSLDFSDDLLSQFDFVVASIHSGFQMSEEAATERLCRALENPHVDILGHPTGRLLLKREGYSINHERVIACAAQHGKAIELNSHPQRLDLDWRWILLAMQSGVPVPINPDAHEIDGLDDIEYGLDVAAKAPMTLDHCPPAWTADELLKWCTSHELPNA